MAQLANLTTTLAIESASFVNGIEQSRGAVRRLLQQLDPTAAAIVRYKSQLDLLEATLKKDGDATGALQLGIDRLKKKLEEATAGGTNLTRTSGMMRSGFQQLGYQLNDISEGFAQGTKFSMIFAQQSGQVIQSLQLMSGETEGVLAILGGPWGAVLGAALVAATPFVAKLFEGNNALDDQVAKLQKDAQQTAITEKAKEQFGRTLEGVTQAIKDQKKALDAMADSDQTAAQAALTNAKAQVQKTADVLRATAATLRQTAAEAAAAHQVNFGAAGGAGAAYAQQFFDNRVNGLLARAKDAETAADAAQKLVSQANYTVSIETAKRLADPVQVVTKKYDDLIAKIQQTDIALINAGKSARSDSAARVTALENEKKARIDAIQSASSEASKARRKAESEAKAAARAALKDAEAQAKLIASASAGAYKAIAGLDRDNNKALTKMFGDEAKSWDDYVKQATTAFKAAQDIEIQNEKDLQAVRMNHLRDLADTYYDLFDGGTKRLWSDFERWGYGVISKLLAQWTMASLFPQAGQSKGFFGNLFSAIGQTFGGGVPTVDIGAARAGADAALASIPHFAGGGSFRFGGMDGIDKNILSLNGSPIAAVTKGETATIGRGAANDRGPIVFDLRGAVMTQDLLDQMNALAATNSISVVGAAQKAQAKQAARRLGR
jgi:hypothetical protein